MSQTGISTSDGKIERAFSLQLGARHVYHGRRAANLEDNELLNLHENSDSGKVCMFHPTFWDIFILCITQVLEDHSDVSVMEVYIWQKFVRIIVQWMREGYEQEHRKKQKEKKNTGD